MKTTQIIEKEVLTKFRFPKLEVLHNPIEIGWREKSLERALALGNLEHEKVKITFLDSYFEPFQVETTIWAVTEESICLKGNLFIPKRAVLNIE